MFGDVPDNFSQHLGGVKGAEAATIDAGGVIPHHEKRTVVTIVAVDPLQHQSVRGLAEGDDISRLQAALEKRQCGHQYKIAIPIHRGQAIA